MKTILFSLCLLGILAFAGWSAFSHLSVAPTPSVNEPSITTGSKEELPSVIEGVGYVEPVTEVRRLSFKVGGVIARCNMAIGEQVKKDEPLVVLANSTEALAVDAAERELMVAKAEEARVLRGIHDDRIEAARHRVAAIDSRLIFLEAEVTRNRSLHKMAVSETNRQRTESEYGEAIAERATAKAELAHLEKNVLPEDKVVAAAKVALAEARFKQLRDRLNDTTLFAPFDGTVLELLRREGEGVTTEGREPVLLFADLSRSRVRAEVDERHIADLKVGQTAAIYGRNVGDQRYSGHVSLVKQVMGEKTVFGRASTERKDLDVVQVFIDMDDSFHYPVGLRVDVSITVAANRPNNRDPKTDGESMSVGNWEQPTVKAISEVR
jgi:HlyD family secretion protein